MARKIKSLYYNMKNGIKNIFRWLPIIWELRDWDASYIYELIYKHLTHVEYCLRNYGHLENSEGYANKIKNTIDICNRLMYDEYTLNAIKPVNEKYGKPKLTREKDEITGYDIVSFNYSDDERAERFKAYELAETNKNLEEIKDDSDYTYSEHNDNYLEECLVNLKGKGIVL